MTIYIKGNQSEIIEITIVERLYPNSSDYWDVNFLRSRIKASVNNFNASINCNLRTDELSQLLISIETFLNNNQSLIEFHSMEENLNLEVSFDFSGNVIWKCVLKNSEELPSILSFIIKSSIVDVENLRGELINLLHKYSVLGKP